MVRMPSYSLYEIMAEDIYKDLHERKLFDNSDYPLDSPHYFKENKKVIEKMKPLVFQLWNLFA